MPDGTRTYRPGLSEPKIALIDIETSPIQGLAWTIYDTNLIHVEEPTQILCYAISWLGKDRVTTRAQCDYPDYSPGKLSDKKLVKDLWSDLDKADVVIAHNGDAFDIKKINARFVVHGLAPPSPYKTVDTLKIARKHFKFDSNKLDNLGGYLGVGHKLPHTGKYLWLGCMAGDERAWRIMRRYNAQDIRLLARVYDKIRAWSPSHPVLTAISERGGCPTCQSQNIQRRGWNIAKTRKTPRWQCQACGHWWSEAIKA